MFGASRTRPVAGSGAPGTPATAMRIRSPATPAAAAVSRQSRAIWSTTACPPSGRVSSAASPTMAPRRSERPMRTLVPPRSIAATKAASGTTS